MHPSGDPLVGMFLVLEFMAIFIAATRTARFAEYTVTPRLNVTPTEG